MMPEAVFAGLAIAVFGSSVLQSVTGIGYGVIAGPVFLVVLNGPEAFHISTVHNLLIALALAPVLRREVDWQLLPVLVLGAALGIPAGFALQVLSSVVALKLVSAAIVVVVAGVLVHDMWRARRGATAAMAPGGAEIALVGAVAGTMGGMLAMPGPVTSTWMSLRGWPKSPVRATVLAFFVFSYGVGLAVYGAFGAVSRDTLTLSALLAPFVVLGLILGHRINRQVSEALFRQLLLAVLALTVLGLLVSLI